ncbi:sugar phosphate isomerase/epimerase family protein [Microbacterium sp.]|uniref:sugar phosphate isomerase/epimerase family protein n=1 Tax=Microbacterium sp. TaxID=51671 RepID=UPI003F970122
MIIDCALDHLTALELSPPELVDAAAHAGFSHVGIRVRPMDDTELPWPMAPGSAMLAETKQRLGDTGVRVSQVEVVFLDERVRIPDLERELSIGAELGARFLYTVGMDADLDRFADRFAELDRLADQYGIRPVVEPMAYRPVRDLATAMKVVSVSEHGGVLVDSLHHFRAGDSVGALASADPNRILVAQLCDAPAEPPTRVPEHATASRGQRATGIPPLQWEARVGRRVPGDGALPLVDFVRALPDGVQLAVEVPDASAIAAEGLEAFLSRVARAASNLVEAAR